MRAALERHGLPEARFVRLWGGMGSNYCCEACGQIIGPDDAEFESEFRHGAESITLRLHRRCWENWHLDASAE